MLAGSHIGQIPLGDAQTSGITGTSAITAAPGTSSASGLLIFTGSSAATATAATSEATGALTFTGSSAQTATAATGEASGLLIFTGTSAVAAAPGTTEATGNNGITTGTSDNIARAATSSAAGSITGVVDDAPQGGPAFRPKKKQPRRNRVSPIELPNPIPAITGMGANRLAAGACVGIGQVTPRNFGSADAMQPAAVSIGEGYVSRGRAAREKEISEIMLAIAGNN